MSAEMDEFSDPPPLPFSCDGTCPACGKDIDDLCLVADGGEFPCPHCEIGLTCESYVSYRINIVPVGGEASR